MKLAPQSFSYLPNTSFRGPEHLWVEWDPAHNPERRDPTLLGRSQPVRIGESSRAGTHRNLRIERKRTAARGVVELCLVPADGRPLPRWAPGSHIDIACGDTGLWRQYSLCGDPADGSLRIAVLLEAESRGGSAWIHSEAREGEVLKVRGPRNHFRLDEDGQAAVFVAGGIGITPIAAMARRAKALGMDYRIHYCGRSRETMAYVDELAALHGERLQLHVKDEGTRADFAALLESPREGTRVYACGPQRMLEALERCCATWPEDALRVEHFQAGAGTLDPSREHAFEVELKDSGLVLQVPPDRTLLQSLRAANIDVQSDCGEGLCGSCEVQVLCGTVDHRDVVLTRAEREENRKMMACCSRAAGQRIVLAL